MIVTMPTCFGTITRVLMEIVIQPASRLLRVRTTGARATTRRGPRFAVLITLAVVVLGLPGCSSTTVSERRDLAPIPPVLLTEMQSKGMTPADPILVRIFKEESELEVWKRDRSGRYVLLKTYPLCRWSGQLGPKRREGDRQAPEGFYTVRRHQLNPNSLFHLSFDLGFPNALERAQGYTGTSLMVHGACTSSGCFAMTDSGVSEVYALAREAFAAGIDSFQVQSFPFRMTPRNLARHRRNPNHTFWSNLREGNDHFLAMNRPPEVTMCGGRYRFNARLPEDSGRIDPSRACPNLQTDPSIEAAVAVRRHSDDALVQQFVQGGLPAIRLEFADGGMHANFQEILRREGAQRLMSITSGRVEISRPLAVLYPPKEFALTD
jgi:murein L,D-transpeptidase YafK